MTKKKATNAEFPSWAQLGEKWHALWEPSEKHLCGAPVDPKAEPQDLYDPTPGNDVCTSCLKVLAKMQHGG